MSKKWNCRTSSNLAKFLKKLRKAGKVSQNDLRVLEQFYTKGSASFGPTKSNKRIKKKIENFLQTKNAHPKYRQVRRNFLRLKVIAYDINEIWSIDVAYVASKIDC